MSLLNSRFFTPSRDCRTLVLPLLCCLFVLSLILPQSASWSQQPGYTPEQIQEYRERYRSRRAARMEVQQVPTPGNEENREEEKKDENNEEGEKKPDDSAATIKRPTDRPPEYDPNRTKLKPDENGRVQFSYMGQPWTDVLQDYADAAGYTFDWLELPADFLNLTTQRSYTLDEARDLLNRHLLARGFTLVVKGELLTAVKIEQLDPSLLPRVEPDNLEDHLPYDFVRVQFELPSEMDPAKTAEDVQVLLSPRATVRPLLASKRLLVIDAVANLRMARDMLYGEQMAAASNIQPRFYRIKYRRADLVADQIMIILGLDPKTRNAPQDSRMDPRQMQMVMQMQQKGQDVSKLLNAGAPKVFVTVDRQQNVILVNAPQDKFDEIERTIEYLDVGQGKVENFDQSDGRFTIERYKTVSADSEAVIEALYELGNLDPLTQLQTDSRNDMIFAYAPMRDHAKIKAMIGKLDGTGRKPEVIWLPPKLPADQVAGSIQQLIVGNEEEDNDDNDRFSYFFGRSSRSSKKSEPSNKGFRVLPDIENNRLLLWASDDELAEVNKLIDKLRANPDGSFGDNRTVRRFRTQNAGDVQELLEKLKATWPGENELEIKVEPPASETKESDSKNKQVKEEDDQLTAVGKLRFRLAQTVVEPAEEEAAITEQQQAETEKAVPPPIKITVNAEGEIVIASQDTKALDQLQQLIESLTPSEPEYHYFKLKYVSASDVVYNLEKYFEDVIGEDDDDDRYRYYWWGEQSNDNEEPMTLGKRRPLRLIDDFVTNTVIVANANAKQLKIITDIIQQYDQLPEPQEYLQRKTEVVQVKYSRASDIAASLKDVYRDLLSSRDKEFQDKDGKSTAVSMNSRNYVFGEVQRELVDQKKPVVIKFQGVLSVGIDEVSNSLIICAREELMKSVVKTIRDLDEAAKPDTVVRTHEVRGVIDAETLKRALSRAVAQPWPGGKPAQAGGQQNGQRAQQNQQREAERREAERRRDRGNDRGRSSRRGR